MAVILYGSSAKNNLKVAYAVATKVLGDGAQKYVLSNSYPDFMLVSKNSDDNVITVDNVRPVSEFLSQSSEFGGYKVVIIDSAEEMNDNAANSILKTLEEPQGQAVIILTTTKLFGLLPTIRSRCQKIFVKGNADRRYSTSDKFYNDCIDFFGSNMEDIPGFAKAVLPEQKDVFCDIILDYAYCKFMYSLTETDAQNYIDLSEFINKARYAYLDQQSFISACCLKL